MELAFGLAGGLALIVWIGLLTAHAGFWRADQRLGDPPAPVRWPAVTAIVPARDEAATVADTVAAIRAQDYPGALRLLVVDDGSSDGTAGLARSAGAEVLAAPPLAPGWTGKLHALETGVAASDTEFLWFTDADIVHGPDILRRLVARALAEDRDLASLMVRLHVESRWERLLIPAFIFFFQMLYPFPAVNDPHNRTAGAAGGCILIRRAALTRAGGLAALADALIDDCTLARRVQDSGGRLWLGLGESSFSLRKAEGLAPLWAMVKRTAFTQLGHSALLLAGTLVGLALVFLAPPLVTIAGLLAVSPPLVLLGLAGQAAMALAIRPTLRLYGRPAAEGLLLPFVATLYMAMTVDSALARWRGTGSNWKGRAYSARGKGAG